MERHQGLLVAIWREACRHIEISESADTMGGLLAQRVPLEQVWFLRFDKAYQRFDTVALGRPQSRFSSPFPKTSLAAAKLKKLQTWSKEGRVVRLLPGDNRGVFAEVISDELSLDLLVGPLVQEDSLKGLLVIAAKEGSHFDPTHHALCQLLLEPMSVALENDRRLHELMVLREAADADRQTLLRRLGREQPIDSIVGADQGLRNVMERVELVAPSDAPVLVLGDTGTGKEVVARAIHTRSPRHSGPFIRVNCGAIPPDLIDSQLFGHEKGSFTGASETRTGWFERADHGTLFLDEMGELPLAAQVRLLRVLQDGFIERVGGVHPIRVDVRIIAATHRDLPTMVRENRFREDLWYRIAVFPILLPPLRERREDIPALVHHFAQRAAHRFGLPSVEPTDEDLRLLMSYSWPGNIRELAAVIDRAAILGRGQTLEVATALGGGQGASSSVPIAGTQTLVPHSLDSISVESPNQKEEEQTLDSAIRRHICWALAECRGKIEGPKGAADLLRINPHTLRAKMRKLQIDWSEFRS